MSPGWRGTETPSSSRWLLPSHLRSERMLASATALQGRTIIGVAQDSGTVGRWSVVGDGRPRPRSGSRRRGANIAIGRERGRLCLLECEPSQPRARTTIVRGWQGANRTRGFPTRCRAVGASTSSRVVASALHPIAAAAGASRAQNDADDDQADAGEQHLACSQHMRVQRGAKGHQADALRPPHGCLGDALA